MTKTTDKLLFTPGPLTTSATVKAAMMRDAGSRDADFIAAVRDIRERLLRIGGTKPGGDYECVPMQGSGTFAIEAVISSAIPRDGCLMVLVNGAYGRRIGRDGAHSTALTFKPWRPRKTARFSRKWSPEDSPASLTSPWSIAKPLPE